MGWLAEPASRQRKRNLTIGFAAVRGFCTWHRRSYNAVEALTGGRFQAGCSACAKRRGEGGGLIRISTFPARSLENTVATASHQLLLRRRFHLRHRFRRVSVTPPGCLKSDPRLPSAAFPGGPIACRSRRAWPGRGCRTGGSICTAASVNWGTALNGTILRRTRTSTGRRVFTPAAWRFA